MWGLRQWEKLPASQESSLETHRGLERTQAHRPGNQHQKGPLCLWVVGEVTESHQRVQQAPLFPQAPPPHTVSQHSDVLPRPGEHPRPHPLYVTGAPRWKEKKGPNQRTEIIQAPEKIQLSNEEIANLSDTHFKTLVITSQK